MSGPAGPRVGAMANLTLKQLRYFEALARHGHFGRAADACAVPAVTPRRAYVTESPADAPVSIAAIDVASGERRWTRPIPSTADDAGSLTASAPALADDGLVVAVVGNDAFASGRGTYLVA